MAYEIAGAGTFFVPRWLFDVIVPLGTFSAWHSTFITPYLSAKRGFIAAISECLDGRQNLVSTAARSPAAIARSKLFSVSCAELRTLQKYVLTLCDVDDDP